MDGQSTATEAKHQYQQPNQWQPVVSKPATARTAPSTPSTELPPPIYPHLDLQSLYQVQLNFYNELISPGRGGGGGQQPLPLPSASSPRNNATRPRSSSKSSKVSTKDAQHTKPGAQSCHGNRATKNTDTSERAIIASAKELPSKMSAKKHSNPRDNSNSGPAQSTATSSGAGAPSSGAAGGSSAGANGHAPNPSAAVGPGLSPPSAAVSSNISRSSILASSNSAVSGVANPPMQSSSVPSTPHQHARKFSFESREPSPTATQNHSPRSAYSEANGNVPSLRPLPPRLVGGCRYETAIPYSRRRMPYSLGTDKLEKTDQDKIKSKLSEDGERKLTTDMRELYDRLLPTQEIEKNRQKLVQKLETLFNEEWPGHDIRVHLFGSSGNLLCSDDSDVDICITTDWKELEFVCLIAELLARHGMEKVVCVKSAKVPIVKIWDPELGLACDMNVNNTSALENTRMVRTYVEIDERVRPLAMIVKYWTRRRIVNDAAFGGTLSSYTWICMIIAFLQIRDPPVVPSLHQRHRDKSMRRDGRKSEFADDLNKLRGFGGKNKDSLGTLLFQFFRFYAHEFDYDKNVLSVREGKLLSKTEKGWLHGVNNMLCIEEPFNTSRNLGNTADDHSFRGLHLEMRRAFDLLSEGKFEECCEQFVFPKEEERIFQKPSSVPRPILVRSSSQQHAGRGRGGYRGGRQFSRNNNNNNRRASSSIAPFDANTAYAQAGIPTAMSPQDLLWYHQATQPQMSLPQELLGPTLSALAAHETQLRFQLYTQAQQLNQQQAIAHAQRMQGGGGGQSQSADRSRTNSFDNPPLSAPLRPDMVFPSYPYGLPGTAYYNQGFAYPPSPASVSASAGPGGGTGEFRRSLHRTAVEAGTAGGSGALRSQSQPASRTPMPTSAPNSSFPTPTPPLNAASAFPPRQINGVPIPSFIPDEHSEPDFDDAPAKVVSGSPEEDGPRYVGYYVSESTSPARKAAPFPNAVPSFGDLGPGSQTRRRLSTDHTPQSILDRRMRRTSRSPSPLGHARAFSVGTSSAPTTSAPFAQPAAAKLGPPLVVNGSGGLKPNLTPGAAARQSAKNTTPDSHGYDNALHINQGTGSRSEPASASTTGEAGSTTLPERPLVVNGSISAATSASHSPAVGPTMPDMASFSQRLLAGSAASFSYLPLAGDMAGMYPYQPPSGRRVSSRQSQNGIAPLDLATADFVMAQNLQNLSPVYEHRTPSPSAVRKFDGPAPIASSSAASGGDQARTEGSSRTTQKTPPMKTPPTQSTAKLESTNRSPVVESRANGNARENGHVRNAKSQAEAAGTWQKPKSRKKPAADLRNATNGVSQSEQPPRNDSERKGG